MTYAAFAPDAAPAHFLFVLDCMLTVAIMPVCYLSPSPLTSADGGDAHGSRVDSCHGRQSRASPHGRWIDRTARRERVHGARLASVPLPDGRPAYCVPPDCGAFFFNTTVQALPALTGLRAFL